MFEVLCGVAAITIIGMTWPLWRRILTWAAIAAGALAGIGALAIFGAYINYTVLPAVPEFTEGLLPGITKSAKARMDLSIGISVIAVPAIILSAFLSAFVEPSTPESPSRVIAAVHWSLTKIETISIIALVLGASLATVVIARWLIEWTIAQF